MQMAREKMAFDAEHAALDRQVEIAKAMKVRTFKAGDVICEAGDHSILFNILQRGKAVLEGSNQSIRVLSKGDVVDERTNGSSVRGWTVPPMSHPPCPSAMPLC